MTPPRDILALDCAGPACSVAYRRAGQTLSARHEAMTRGHADRIAPMMRDVLAEAKQIGAHLDEADGFAVAVVIGPGAFTGIRIAMAAAQGLALARGAPLLGVTRFEAVLQALASTDCAGVEDHRTLIALETKRTDYYGQAFQAGRPVMDPLAASARSLCDRTLESDGAALLAGDAANRFRNDPEIAERAERFILSDPIEVTAVHVAQAAAAQMSQPGRETASRPVRPLYLRPADTGAPGTSGRDGG